MKQRLLNFAILVVEWFIALSLATWGVTKIEQGVNHPIEGWRNFGVWCILYVTLYVVILFVETVLKGLLHAFWLWLDWHLEGIAYTFDSCHEGAWGNK